MILQYTKRLSSSKPRENAQIDALQLELQTWKQNLPSSLTIDNLQPREDGYRLAFHLRLNYLYAWIVLGKGSLLSTIQAQVRHHKQNSHTVLVNGGTPAFDSLALSCVKASKTILHLFEHLSHNNLIFRFSFTDFQGCSIATIVAIVAGIIERDSEYETRVAFGLNYLRTMALGNLPAEVGVRFIEALQAISNEAFTKFGSVSSPGGKNDQGQGIQQGTRYAAGYGQWAQWVSSKANLGTEQQRSVPFEVSDSNFGSAMPTTTIAEFSENDLPKWTGSEARQDLSNAGTVDSPQLPLDVDPQMIWSHDDQMALMGLTGLDMLEFEAIPSHVNNPY